MQSDKVSAYGLSKFILLSINGFKAAKPSPLIPKIILFFCKSPGLLYLKTQKFIFGLKYCGHTDFINFGLDYHNSFYVKKSTDHFSIILWRNICPKWFKTINTSDW